MRPKELPSQTTLERPGNPDSLTPDLPVLRQLVVAPAGSGFEVVGSKHCGRGTEVSRRRIPSSRLGAPKPKDLVARLETAPLADQWCAALGPGVGFFELAGDADEGGLFAETGGELDAEREAGFVDVHR